MLFAGLFLGTVGQAADHAADLVDDFRMPGAECDMRVGMLGLEFQRLVQTVLDLAAQALGQRLADGNALAVTTQRVGVDVPGIGVLRFGLLQCDAAFGDVFEKPEPRFLVFLQMVGIDHCRLVGCVDA